MKIKVITEISVSIIEPILCGDDCWHLDMDESTQRICTLFPEEELGLAKEAETRGQRFERCNSCLGAKIIEG